MALPGGNGASYKSLPIRSPVAAAAAKTEQRPQQAENLLPAGALRSDVVPKKIKQASGGEDRVARRTGAPGPANPPHAHPARHIGPQEPSEPVARKFGQGRDAAQARGNDPPVTGRTFGRQSKHLAALPMPDALRQAGALLEARFARPLGRVELASSDLHRGVQLRYDIAGEPAYQRAMRRRERGVHRALPFAVAGAGAIEEYRHRGAQVRPEFAQ